MTHSTLGILLLTLSAITHATWNAIVKKSKRSSKEFFFLANIFGLILFLPLLFFVPWKIIAIPHIIWILVFLVGLIESLYFVTLSKAYAVGELSIVYPIARSFPIIFAMLFGILFQEQLISMHFIMGAIITILSCFILSMDHIKDFSLKKYINPSTCFAYITALLTAGYIITDNTALYHLQIQNSTLNFFLLTLLYAFMREISIFIVLGISIFQEKRYRHHLSVTFRENKKSLVLTGLGMKIGYTLILLSMTLIHSIAYIVLFRQLSLPIATLLAIYFANEPNRITKWIGVVMMITGIVLASV